MKCEKAPREGVIPNDKPTVPIADTASKRQTSTGSLSAMLITTAPSAGSVRYIMKIVTALLTVLSSTLLPNSCTLFFLRKTETAFAKRTAGILKEKQEKQGNNDQYPGGNKDDLALHPVASEVQPVHRNIFPGQEPCAAYDYQQAKRYYNSRKNRTARKMSAA